MRSPPAIRELALQRQPTPKMDRTDKNRSGHYLTRTDVLHFSNGNANAVCDLTDLPSKVAQKESSEYGKEETARDVAVTKALGLRSWEGKKVKCVVICFHCNKSRCLYSITSDKFVGVSGESNKDWSLWITDFRVET